MLQAPEQRAPLVWARPPFSEPGQHRSVLFAAAFPRSASTQERLRFGAVAQRGGRERQRCLKPIPCG